MRGIISAIPQKGFIQCEIDFFVEKINNLRVFQYTGIQIFAIHKGDKFFLSFFVF